MDIKLTPTADGGEITLINGSAETTEGLFTAVYISLLGAAWWGNAISETPEKLNSELIAIMSEPLTNKARLNTIEAIKDALQWLLDEGIANSIEVEAEIPNPSRLNLRIIIEEPDRTEDFIYALNWDAQEAETL